MLSQDMVEEKGEFEMQFLHFVMSLESSAWMMLGKIANPLTGKMDKNLDGARATIDTLMMLKEKTKGNLSKAEEDFLSNALQQLQLNYVEEVKLESQRGEEEMKEEIKEEEKEEEKTKKEGRKKGKKKGKK